MLGKATARVFYQIQFDKFVKNQLYWYNTIHEDEVYDWGVKIAAYLLNNQIYLIDRNVIFFFSF